MKFKTFESLLQNCLDLYETACSRDAKIQEALGGDTQVMTDFWDTFICDTISSIEAEYNDTNETVSWLFWESMCSTSDMNFEIDGITYEGSPKNIWLDLNNLLDERVGDIVKVEDEPEFNEADMSTHFKIPTDEELSKYTKSGESVLLVEQELITLRTSGIKVTTEFFNDITEMFDIDLHEVQENQTYSLIDKNDTYHIMTTKENMINIQRNNNVEYGNMERSLTKEELVKAHDMNKLKEVDMSHLAGGTDAWETPEYRKPIASKDFKDNQEFYDYIKYLFECQGINITEVDKPRGDNYEVKTRKFETEDFNQEIKTLIYDKSIFNISLYSASFVEVIDHEMLSDEELKIVTKYNDSCDEESFEAMKNYPRKRAYMVRLDWGN